MKYIKKVTLENFQSHKYTVIEFKEQLNVIVGPSDSGKSAIIRGIKWALYNEPSGDYFIKEGEKECSVTIEFNDNVKLKRYRSKYKNSYILTNKNGEEVKFEGFGSTIPDEIIEITGIKKIYLDSDESSAINLGEQLEGAFLLGERSATRASAIGRLVGVNIIDDALREVLKDNRNLNIQKKGIDETVNSLETEIKEFDYLEELKIKSSRIENLKAKIIDLSNTLERIKLSHNKLNNIKDESDYLNGILNKFNKVDQMQETIIVLDNKTLIYRQLSRHNIVLKKVRKSISDSDYIISKLSSLEMVQKQSKVLDDLCNQKGRLENCYNIYKRIKDEEESLRNTTDKLNKLPELSLKIDYMDNNYRNLTHLKQIMSNYMKIRNSIEFGTKYLSGLDEIPMIDQKKDNLVIKLDILRKYHKLYEELLTNDKEKRNENENLEKLRESINIELSKYEDLLKKLEICPFCLSNINDTKIEHIINHYIGG